MKVVLCLPTYNPGKFASKILAAIQSQDRQPDVFMVIDSSSTDDSIELFKKFGAKVHSIPKSKFNHGGTRNLFREIEKGDLYLYLTQDAIPADPHSFKKLLEPFQQDDKIAMVYGRQIPHPGERAFGVHARQFNYGADSIKKTMQDSLNLGIKTPFCSDSFAAYRGIALQEVGGFPENTILSEDMYAAAKLLKKDWAIYYSAEAKVFHSHSYGVWEEFKRYFDIGVFHRREAWIRECFGKAEGEGSRFVQSEFKYLTQSGKAYLLPEWVLRNGMKFIGYRLGLLEANLPLKLKRSCSMSKNYWSE